MHTVLLTGRNISVGSEKNVISMSTENLSRWRCSEMKKLYFLIIVGVFFLGVGTIWAQQNLVKVDLSSQYERKSNFLISIETGKLSWESFIEAIMSQEITIDNVSPPAVANYLEAIANEGLMELIPADYLDDLDLITSLNVVFEDASNICLNKDVYEASLR
jgi:hypothetical protein